MQSSSSSLPSLDYTSDSYTDHEISNEMGTKLKLDSPVVSKSTGSYSIVHEWSIPNFEKIDRKLESEPFSDFPLYGLRWRFIVYPYGDRRQSENYVSVYLQLIDNIDIDALHVVYRMTIIGKQPKVYSESGDDNFLESNHRAWGWSRFVRRTDLVNRMLPADGSFILQCEISYTPDLVERLLPMYGTSLTCVGHLLKDMNKLYATRATTGDISINVHGKQLKAHKVILSSRSDVFRMLLEAKARDEQPSNVIEIEDFQFEVVEAIIEFAYTGATSKIAEHGLEIMKAADFFNFVDLRNICERHLEQCLDLTPESALSVLFDVIMVNSLVLKEKVLEYVTDTKNMKIIQESESWQEMLPNKIVRSVIEELINNYQTKIDSNNSSKLVEVPNTLVKRIRGSCSRQLI